MNQMFDLQLNGYVGVDFNGDDLTAVKMLHACEVLQQDGVSGVLATIITADHDAMCSRLAKIVECREANPLIEKMIAGIHIEGPFLSPIDGFIGAHPPQHSCQANTELAKRLLEAAGGLTKIFTLAPEQDPDAKVTSWLANQNIVVSAGHCDPSIDQLKQGIDAGLSMFTHLGNGCPQQMHRHDNIIQRALSLSEHLWLGLIADGAHVPLFALKNYLDCAGIDRCCVVSDAISATGLGPGRYRLADQEVIIEEDLVPWAEDRSHFVGSACPLKKMVLNLKTIGLCDAEINKLVKTNPRKSIGM